MSSALLTVSCFVRDVIQMSVLRSSCLLLPSHPTNLARPPPPPPTINSVLSLTDFSDYPQTDLLPEEMRDAHAAARSSCRTRAAHGDDSGATRGFANTEIDINTGLVKSARSMRGVMKSEVRVAPVDAGGEGVELVGTKSQEGEAGS